MIRALGDAFATLIGLGGILMVCGRLFRHDPQSDDPGQPPQYEPDKELRGRVLQILSDWQATAGIATGENLDYVAHKFDLKRRELNQL